MAGMMLSRVWRRRFEEDEDFARELLGALPPDPDRGERAYETDERLRTRRSRCSASALRPRTRLGPSPRSRA